MRRNAHQPLHALSAMAYAVLVAAERRIHGATDPRPARAPDGRRQRDAHEVAVEERPPLRALPPA